MLRRVALAFVVLFAVSALASPAAADVLKITSFSPGSGSFGSSVVINGTAFTSITAVKFNGVSAAFVRVSQKKITATVPQNATTGPITVSKATATATSATDFIVVDQVPATAWPMFQHDPQHTGKTTAIGPSTTAVHAQWTYKGQSWIKNEPSIGTDGTLYIGEARYPLCALSSASGTQNWCTSVGGYVDQSSPTIGNPFTKTDAQGSRTVQTIYMGDRNNVFWAIDSEGHPFWFYKINLDGDVRQSAIIGPDPTDTVYMMCGCTTKAVLHAFSKDGVLNWKLDLPQTRDASPATRQVGAFYRLYVITNNGELIAVDDKGTSGQIAWTLPLGNASEHSSPSIGPNGTIYVGTNDGLFAVQDNGTSAQVLPGWPFPTTGDIDTTAAISGGRVFVSSQGPASIRTFYAINPTNPPTQLWSVTGPGTGSTSFAQTPSPVVGGNGLVYAAIGKKVQAFDPASATPSTPRWQYTLGDDAISLTPGDGVLYVSAKDSKVYALVP